MRLIRMISELVTKCNKHNITLLYVSDHIFWRILEQDDYETFCKLRQGPAKKHLGDSMYPVNVSDLYKIEQLLSTYGPILEIRRLGNTGILGFKTS